MQAFFRSVSGIKELCYSKTQIVYVELILSKLERAADWKIAPRKPILIQKE